MEKILDTILCWILVDYDAFGLLLDAFGLHPRKEDNARITFTSS